MSYISDPKIYLVTKPSINWAGVASMLRDEGVPPIPESIRAGEDESAAIIEISARLCYMSFGRGRKDIVDFIHNLLEKGDGSVFEHANYGFVFTGISRSLTHELVRHRAGFAYSQRSQRFVDESSSPFVIPPALSKKDTDTDAARNLLEKALEASSSAYSKLVTELEKNLPPEMFDHPRDHRKAVRQAARSVLPNASETKIFVTANVRSWRHFIELRGADSADWEIRRLAIKVLEVLREESPMLFGDFTITALRDGTQTAVPTHHKI